MLCSTVERLHFLLCNNMHRMMMMTMAMELAVMKMMVMLSTKEDKQKQFNYLSNISPVKPNNKYDHI